METEEQAKIEAQAYRQSRYPGRISVLTLPNTCATTVQGFYGLQAEGGRQVALVPMEFTSAFETAELLAERWNSWEPGGSLSGMVELLNRIAGAEREIWTSKQSLEPLLRTTKALLDKHNTKAVRKRKESGDGVALDATGQGIAENPVKALRRKRVGSQSGG